MAYVFQTERKILKECVTKFSSRLTGKLLDIGGGSVGRYKNLLTHAAEYNNMEIEPGPGVDIVGRIENIPLPDGSIDSILCMQVILEVFNVDKAIGEMARVLKTGGVALISFPFLGPLVDEPYDCWRFTPYSIKQLLEPHGLSIELIENQGGFFSVGAQFLTRYIIERGHIYQHPILAKLFNYLAWGYGSVALWLDHLDKSNAGRIFTCGYTVIAVKR